MSSLTANIHTCADRTVRKKSHRIKKQTDVSVLLTDRDVRGTPGLRFRWRITVRDVRLASSDCIQVFSGPHE